MKVDGKPSAVKVARSVWGGGKVGDSIKNLPIATMPCTWLGWSYAGCKASGNGYINVSESVKSSVQNINKHGGYGVDGNGDGKASMWDPADAIFAAAKYLKANGDVSAKKNPNQTREEYLKKAIYGYNHSQTYVDGVYNKAMEFKNAATYEDSSDPTTVIIAQGSVKNSAGFIYPLPKGTSRISSHYGPRNLNGSGPIHRGIDLSTNDGTPIYSIAEGGKVIKTASGCPRGEATNRTTPRSACGGGWGNHAIIHYSNVNGKSYDVVYAHLLKGPSVSKGATVQLGQQIGETGSSGNSTGGHLHLEIHSPNRLSSNANAKNPYLYLPRQ